MEGGRLQPFLVCRSGKQTRLHRAPGLLSWDPSETSGETLQLLCPSTPCWKMGDPDRPTPSPLMSAGSIGIYGGTDLKAVIMHLAKDPCGPDSRVWLSSVASAQGRRMRNRASIYRVVFTSQWLIALERSSSRKLSNCFLNPFIP